MSYPLITWTQSARQGLSSTFCESINAEIATAFPNASTIIVKQRFTGYADVWKEKLIVAIEVQSALATSFFVAKIGDCSHGKTDVSNWARYAGSRGIRSRVFIEPIACESISPDRSFILYPDLYQYFHNDGKDQEPNVLEAIIDRSIWTSNPTGRSVETIIRQVYNEGYRCFYTHARESEDRDRISRWAKSLLNYESDKGLLGIWSTGIASDIRRYAIRLTTGNRDPNDQSPPGYLDPVDFMAWSLNTLRIPSMFFGPAHGDLHARNIIAGVGRGEAEWPAVIDFDNLTDEQPIVWDFVKLEQEVKCRLFQKFLDDPQILKQMRCCLGLPEPREGVLDFPFDPSTLATQQSAERMEIIYTLEQVLADLMLQLDSGGRAGDSDWSFSFSAAGCPELDRAIRILFKIRREASMALQFERRERETSWLAEYFWALCLYGLMTVKWHQTESIYLEWTVISAGVAASRTGLIPWPVDNKVEPNPESAASYLELLPFVARCWSTGEAEKGLSVLRSGIDKFPNAAPLKHQLALHLLEVTQDFSISGPEIERQTERIVEELKSQAHLCLIFNDIETLSRLGRYYKNQGDTQYVYGTTYEYAIKRWTLLCHNYKEAYEFYRKAYAVSKSSYPAVNVATMALLCGETQESRRFAEETLKLIREQDSDLDYWVCASCAEAYLLLGQTDPSAAYYRSAIEQLKAEELGVIQSMYDQICRLHWALGSDVVDPVLETLRQYEWFEKLKPGPLGNCNLL